MIHRGHSSFRIPIGARENTSRTKFISWGFTVSFDSLSSVLFLFSSASAVRLASRCINFHVIAIVDLPYQIWKARNRFTILTRLQRPFDSAWAELMKLFCGMMKESERKAASVVQRSRCRHKVWLEMSSFASIVHRMIRRSAGPRRIPLFGLIFTLRKISNCHVILVFRLQSHDKLISLQLHTFTPLSSSRFCFQSFYWIPFFMLVVQSLFSVSPQPFRLANIVRFEQRHSYFFRHDFFCLLFATFRWLFSSQCTPHNQRFILFHYIWAI